MNTKRHTSLKFEVSIINHTGCILLSVPTPPLHNPSIQVEELSLVLIDFGKIMSVWGEIMSYYRVTWQGVKQEIEGK